MWYSGLVKSSGWRVLEQCKEAINYIMMQCCFKCNRWQLHICLLHYTLRICYGIVLNYVCIWLAQSELNAFCSSLRVCLHDHTKLCRCVCVDCMPVTALKTTGALLYVTLGIEMCHLYYPLALCRLGRRLCVKLISRLTLVCLTLNAFEIAVEGWFEYHRCPYLPRFCVFLHV